MFSKKFKIIALEKALLETYFTEDNKINEFINSDYPIKVLNEYQYTYGFDINGLDYFFAIRNNVGEGFIFFRYTYKESNRYASKFNVYSTKDFEKVKSFYENNFKIETLRKINIERYKIDLYQREYSIDKLYCSVIFNSIITKPMRAKLLGLLGFLYCLEDKTAWAFEEIENLFPDTNENVLDYLNKNILRLIDKKVEIRTIFPY